MTTTMRWPTAVVAAICAGIAGIGGGTAAAAPRHAVRAFTPTSGPRLVPDKINTRHITAEIPIYTLCGSAAAAHGLHCYSPQQLQDAYGLAPLFARHVNGRRETVVLPEETFPARDSHRLPAHEGLYLRESLHAYDILFHLPGARLRINTSLADHAPADRVATQEEILDVEMVHAMAPSARIVVDLVTGDPAVRLPALLRLASHQGKIVSFSYGAAEGCLRHEVRAYGTALNAARRHGVSVFASSGDSLDMSTRCSSDRPNGRRSVTMPASDPLVTAVGGTQLSIGAGNAYGGETAWNQQTELGHGGPQGGGGGFSVLFRRPSYQKGVPGIGRRRGDPDVAFSASELYGVEVVLWVEGRACSLSRHPGRGASRLRCVVEEGVGGTSVGSPAWAGICALADQYGHRALGFLNPAIYRIARSSAYPSAFHDITSGNNSASYRGHLIRGFGAGPGWDPVTGWGSPNAAVLVPLLAAHHAHHAARHHHRKHPTHRRKRSTHRRKRR